MKCVLLVTVFNWAVLCLMSVDQQGISSDDVGKVWRLFENEDQGFRNRSDYL